MRALTDGLREVRRQLADGLDDATKVRREVVSVEQVDEAVTRAVAEFAKGLDAHLLRDSMPAVAGLVIAASGILLGIVG